MKNIFITFTPYHILLSYSVAFTHHRFEDNILFVISDFAGADKLAKIIEISNNSVFKKVHVLSGNYGKKYEFLKWFVARKNIVELKNILNDFRINRAYSCHDQKAEGQAAFFFTKKNNKNAQCVYIEDGSGAYSESVNKKKPFVKILLGKLLYGFWWKNERISGFSQWTDKIMVVFPQFIRDEIRKRDVIPIKKEEVLKLRQEDIFSNWIKLFEIDLHRLEKIDMILLINRSGSAKLYPEYKKVMKALLRIGIANGLNIALKYHPRETLKDFLSVKNEDKIIILPRALPIEIIYLMKPDSLKFIIGNISTSLLTAKWLLDDCKVFSIAPLFCHYDQRLLKMFKEIDIQLINGENEFEKIFR
jgi:hypothetical protein